MPVAEDKAMKQEPPVSQSNPTVFSSHRAPPEPTPTLDDQTLPQESQSLKGYFTHSCLADLENQALTMQKRGTSIRIISFYIVLLLISLSSLFDLYH